VTKATTTSKSETGPTNETRCTRLAGVGSGRTDRIIFLEKEGRGGGKSAMETAKLSCANYTPLSKKKRIARGWGWRKSTTRNYSQCQRREKGDLRSGTRRKGALTESRKGP